MSPREDSDLGAALAVQLAGMALPVLVVAVSREWLAASLAGSLFVVAAAVAFATVSWVLLDRLAIDDVDFLMASVIGPALVFFAVVVVKAALWQLINFYPGLGLEVPASFWWGVLEYLAPGGPGLFVYVAAFGVAGFAAVVLVRRVHLPVASARGS